MATEIIVAIIAAGGTFAGSLFGVMQSTRLTTYRIDQLEKKVDKHNNIIERTFNLEKQLERDEQKLDDVIGRLK